MLTMLRLVGDAIDGFLWEWDGSTDDDAVRVLSLALVGCVGPNSR